MTVERKNKQAVQQALHPRVVVWSNFQLRYDFGNRAERSRIVQVDLDARGTDTGDLGWEAALLEELPQLLCRARDAWKRLADDGGDIALTSATEALMRVAGEGRMDEFGGLAEKLVIERDNPDVFIPKVELAAAMLAHGITNESARRKWAAKNFKQWLDVRGVKSSTRQLDPTNSKDKTAVWVGIRWADGARPASAGRPGFGRPNYTRSAN
jgi:hypothetical protein